MSSALFYVYTLHFTLSRVGSEQLPILLVEALVSSANSIILKPRLPSIRGNSKSMLSNQHKQHRCTCWHGSRLEVLFGLVLLSSQETTNSDTTVCGISSLQKLYVLNKPSLRWESIHVSDEMFASSCTALAP